MKRTIIPAGTPGTFRPEWGQFPEPTARIDVWEIYPANSNSGQVIRYTDQLLEDVQDCYAWSYAPVAPPVDGLEAFKTEWNGYSGLSFLRGDYFYNTRLKQLKYKLITIGEFPTLAAAQEAAYAHFLSTLND